MTASLCSPLGGAAVLAAIAYDAVDRHAVNPHPTPLLRGNPRRNLT